MGSALAGTLGGAGHDVIFGVRDPSGGSLDGVPLATVAAACEGADVVVLATPAAVVPAVVQGLPELEGAVVVDATNPLRWESGPVHAPPAEGSMTAHLQALRPDLVLVKAWNTFGAEFMAASEVSGQPVTLLLAGDSGAAKERIGALGRSAGFAPVDAGPLRNAALLEQQAMLWIHLATVGGQGRGFTFQLTRS